MTYNGFNLPPQAISDYNYWDSDGTTTEILIGFDIFDQSTKSDGLPSEYLYVYQFDGVNITRITDWELYASKTKIKLSKAYDVGITIIWGRKLNIDAPELDFTALSVTGANLNRMQAQFIQNDQGLWRRINQVNDKVNSVGASLGGVIPFTFTATSGQTTFTLTNQAGIPKDNIQVAVGSSTTNLAIRTHDDFEVSDNGSDLDVVMDVGITNGYHVEITVWQANLVGYTIEDGSVTNTKLAGGITFDKVNFDASGSNNQALMKRSGSAVFSTILTSDVSGLTSAITSTPLSSFAAAAANINLNGKKFTNAANGSSDADYATVGQVNTAIAAAMPASSAPSMFSGSVTFSSTTYTTETIGFDWDYMLIIVSFSGGDAAITTTGQYIARYNDIISSTDISTEQTYKIGYGSMPLTGNFYEIKLHKVDNGFEYKRAGSNSATYTLKYVAWTNYVP